jgi:hypothetical protein
VKREQRTEEVSALRSKHEKVRESVGMSGLQAQRGAERWKH